MRLLKQLRKKPFCNDFHFFLIGSILLLLGFKYWPFFIVLGLYVVFLFLKTKLVLPVCILLGLLSVEMIGIEYLHHMNLPNEGKYYITDVKDENTYYAYGNGIKLLVIEYNHENEPGDYIFLSLEIVPIEGKAYSTDFDYQEYLYTKGISYRVKGKTKNRIQSLGSLSLLKYKYMSYLKENLSEASYSYVSAMVFGENTLEDSLKESYSILGISHILAISGLHILFLYKVISFLMLKLFKYYKNLIPLGIVSIFTLLIGAPASALRATLFLLIGAWNKKGELSYTRLDILSISCIFMLLVNPYQVYATGFILSYLVSFVLLFSGDIFDVNNKLIDNYLRYYLIYFSTFPFVINMTNRMSIISLLLSPILTIVVTFLLLPLSFLLSVFPILDIVIQYIFQFLNVYIENLAIKELSIAFPSLSVWMIVLYYILFIGVIISILFKRKRTLSIGLLFTFFVIFLNVKYVNPYYRVTFIDCGQGDSILIECPKNQGTILIDCYHAYDYLKNRGISEIDAVIFTHSDNDHVGDYKEILDSIKVKNIYYPKCDSKMKSIISNYQAKALVYEDSIHVGGLEFKVVGPIRSSKEVNSNSLVLDCLIDGVRYLFTGDMTVEEEKDILEVYPSLDIDILKVGHHGSLTSSSVSFLDAVSPSISVISVGYQNSYGLPDSEILSRLRKQSSVYMTKDLGNITIYHRKGSFHISTYR